MSTPVSLRQSLTRLVFAAGLAPLLVSAAMLAFWLMPTLEKQVSDGNRRLAITLATQAEVTLLPPRATLETLAGTIDVYERSGQLQAALDTVAASSALFESVYAVDAGMRIRALAVPGHANGRDFIQLDVSGSPVLQQAKKANTVAWSDAYRSPISDQSVAAAVVPAGKQLLVGEISLRRLSDFVARLSGDHATLFILDRRGAVVAHPDPNLAAQQINFSNLELFQEQELLVTRQFTLGETRVIGTRVPIRELGWHVVVTQPLATVRQPIVLMTFAMVTLTLLGIALAWWLGQLVARRVASRFERLVEVSDQVATGHYPDQWPAQTLLEAQRLNDGMRRMSEAIREREQAWRELNQNLESRVAERTAALRQTEATLARSEKLASLGSLVAGVAHELNTPIGNGLMAATALQDRTQEFTASMQAGLRRSDLERYVTFSDEVTDLVVRNLARASELIGSFKQVAVDQTTAQRRRFELAEHLHEITTTLTPTLRKKQCSVENDLTPGILLDSFPGPLGQVLVNLIANAVHHGYRDQPGTVFIRTRALPGEQAEISVSDHGRGISPAHIGRIFDPFFTTEMGQGGSGLGLHICYNIVSDLLGGRIEVASEEGRGTTFTLVLPLVAPHKRAEAVVDLPGNRSGETA